MLPGPGLIILWIINFGGHGCRKQKRKNNSDALVVATVVRLQIVDGGRQHLYLELSRYEPGACSASCNCFKPCLSSQPWQQSHRHGCLQKLLTSRFPFTREEAPGSREQAQGISDWESRSIRGSRRGQTIWTHVRDSGLLERARSWTGHEAENALTIYRRQRCRGVSYGGPALPPAGLAEIDGRIDAMRRNLDTAATLHGQPPGRNGRPTNCCSKTNAPKSLAAQKQSRSDGQQHLYMGPRQRQNPCRQYPAAEAVNNVFARVAEYSNRYARN